MHFVDLYNLFGLNRWLFLAINRAHTPAIDGLAMLGSVIGNFWNFPVVIVLGMLIVWLPRRSLAAARWLPDRQTTLRVLLRLTLGYVLAMAIVGLLKFGLSMPRPSMALPAGSVQLLGGAETSGSFPSGHATFAMLLVVSVWSSCREEVQGLLILFAVWVGLSRIAMGAHFPVDVLGGYASGALSAWIAARLLAAYARRQRQRRRAGDVRY
ncbi:MAG: phosphatase PAP2 family protein [Comamonadaceae bacterium]|nr:MAG: phosphatase PAP2 family protein [Comamonadaceae bacterium]